MWKSLDNVLLICEISLLLAALVTCSTEAPDYSQVNWVGNGFVLGLWVYQILLLLYWVMSYIALSQGPWVRKENCRWGMWWDIHRDHDIPGPGARPGPRPRPDSRPQPCAGTRLGRNQTRGHPAAWWWVMCNFKTVEWIVQINNGNSVFSVV